MGLRCGSLWPARRRCLGFSLLDTLTVAAALAIASAIAVPNYVTAQTRAKIGRTKTDMRNMAIAAEAYTTDNQMLGRTYRSSAAYTRTMIASMLTTPVAYLPQIYPDVFNTSDPNPLNRVFILWGRNPQKDGEGTAKGYLDVISPGMAALFFQAFPDFYNSARGGYATSNAWLIYSLGPDGLHSVLTPVYPSPFAQYDPTNGTLSGGDLIRFQ